MSPTVAVLLSGGMDSAICLFGVLDRSPVAVVADYGQPSQERLAAKHVAWMCGVPVVQVAFTMPNLRRDEFDIAFLPGRNLVLLTLAAAAIKGDCVLVIGATLEDQDGFPDCRPAFMDAAGAALSLALGKSVTVIAPLAAISKRDAYRALSPYQRDLIGSTVSCYAGIDCGTCGACLKRRAALA